MWVGPYAAQAVIAGQVAEVRMSLAVVAPWLWLMKMKLAELPLMGLAQAELARTELMQTELVQTELTLV